MVLPDDRHKNFMLIDSDHKFRCYPETIEQGLGALSAQGGAHGVLLENGTTVLPAWSFFSLIRRA